MEDPSRTPRSNYNPKTRTDAHDGHMHLSRADLGSLAGTKDGSLETHVHLRRTGSMDIFAGPPSPSSHHHLQQQQHQQGAGSSSYTYTTNTTGMASNTSSSTSFRRPSPPPPPSSTTLPPAYPSSSHHHHQSPAVSKSSTAVLSALRALQDKIKRLEKERADAILEVGMLRQQLEGVQRRAELQRREDVLELQEQCSHVQGAYERLLSEKAEVESKLVRSEEKRAGLIQEAGRLRGQLLAEEESRRVAEARVRGVEARIGKMERAVQNRGVAAEDTIAELREALKAETARRLELEERNETFGEVLLSVLDMNQELARHYPVPETKSRGTTTSSRTSASTLRMAPKPRPSWTSSNNGGTLPFLPASHHRTYNLLATLSLAVRECKQREPKQVLGALYELVQQDSGSVIGREGRRAFPLSSGSASASFPSTTRTHGRPVYLAKGRRRTAAAERAEEEERQRQQEEQQEEEQQQREAEEHDEEVVLAVQAELEEVESLLEEELRGLNRKYAGMVELARKGGRKMPGSGGGGGGGEGEFREEDLRALIEDIHRKEAELKHLRRALRSKRGHCQLRHHRHHHHHLQQQQQQQQQQVPCTSPRAKSAAQRVRERMSLLSGIRDVSGLAAAGK